MVSDVGAFIAKRLPWAVLTIFLASLLSFSLLYFSPGNSAEMILSAEMGHEPTQEAVQSFVKNFGLDEHFISQYLGWMSNILHGSFGSSLRTGDPVLEEFMARFPATFILALSALSFALIIGVSFGVLSAVKPNSWLDYLGNVIASTGIAIPSFWLGLLLIFFFSIQLNILPSFGYGGLEHLILPTIALGSHQVARIL
ncbi:MAG: ABC transporter permease, partial [Archaeoglobaceae archaeon]